MAPGEQERKAMPSCRFILPLSVLTLSSPFSVRVPTHYSSPLSLLFPHPKASAQNCHRPMRGGEEVSGPVPAWLIWKGKINGGQKRGFIKQRPPKLAQAWGWGPHAGPLNIRSHPHTQSRLSSMDLLFFLAGGKGNRKVQRKGSHFFKNI